MTERAAKTPDPSAGPHRLVADADRLAHRSGEAAQRGTLTAGAPSGPSPVASSLTPGQVLAFQRSAGNAAVARSVARGVRPRPRPQARTATQRSATAQRSGRQTVGGQAPARRGGGEPPGPGASPATSEPADQDVATPALQAFLQRDLATVPPPPVAPQPVAPADDPAFTKISGQIAGAAAGQRAHPSAKSSVAAAEAAAVAPPNDLAAQASVAQVDKMAGAKPGGFDKAAFIAAVGKAIDAAAPKNAEEATELGSSGKSGAVKAQVEGMVGEGKQGAAKDIKGATEAPPDLSKATPKPVIPLAPADPGAPPPAIPGAAAMPSPRDPDQTNLGNGPASVNNRMAEAGVTEDQLAKSNEPQFTQALGARQDLETHSSTAPPRVRDQEAKALGHAQAGAAGGVNAGLAGMRAQKVGAVAAVASQQGNTKSADQVKRAEVAGHIEQVFTKTKGEVDQILNGLDEQVDDAFTTGEKQARDAFDADVARDMEAWKDERYSGVRGKLRWLKDKLLGAPPEVNQIFAKHRNAYVAQMSKVIADVADVVGAGLTKATRRIADGRAEVKKYVADQPASLRQFAAEAEDKVSDKFDALDSDVSEKQEAVVSDLAQKYTEARQSVDDAITKMQEENKGLVQKAEEAVVGAVETILKLKDMLLGVLSRVAGAVTKIIADPIGFLEKLVNAVKTGLHNFVSNIGTHLKKGLTDWLFGALGSAGIEIPDTFDLKGILKLVLSILGLTWTSIRSKLVAQVGEPVMSRIEQTVDVFKTIATEGLGGLWNLIVQKLGDFKEMVMGEIESFIEDKVITAGIEWIVGLLNPAGAFIKACEAIYHIVMFFVEKGQAIMDFVNSILDSVEAILGGGVGAVADLIEGTLAKMIPLIITFLADLLGLGGISEKIKEIIGKIQKPVNKVINAVIGGALKVGKKLFRGLLTKGKAAAGYVKGKIAAGKEWVAGKAKQAVGFFSIRKPFQVKGEDHVLYNDGQSDALVVASTPTRLDQHPDPDVKKAYIAYLQAMAGAQTPSAKENVSRKYTADIITALRAWMTDHATSDPGASAPGLGEIARHGAQGSRLYNGPAIYHLESEHITPFAVGKRLWQAVNLYVPERGGHEDDGQTTIAIYKGAADLKTEKLGESRLMSDFEAAINRAEIPRRLRDARRGVQAGSEGSRQTARDLVALLMQGLRVAKNDSVERTNRAIAMENASVSGGSKRTNGERRGPAGSPEPPSPSPGLVDRAAEEQYDNVVNLVQEEVEGVTTRREAAAERRLGLRP